MSTRRLLLISRDDIIEAVDSEPGSRLLRLLARFTRHGFHLLATAPQPERWTTHGGPDDALLGPDSIRKRLSEAGGLLDGVYYVRRSLLTQRRNREQALEDILKRYGVSPDQCHLFSSSVRFVQAARDLGIHATDLDQKQGLMAELEQLSRHLDRQENIL